MTPERLKQLRECLGLSQAEVAKGLYVSKSLVQKWESGERAVNGYADAIFDFFISYARRFADEIVCLKAHK